MAATAVGMVLSCLRWLLVDHILEWMGIQGSNLNFRQIGNHLEAFDYLFDNHNRFYQFYTNTLMAIVCTYPLDRLLQTSPLLGTGTDSAVLFLCLCSSWVQAMPWQNIGLVLVNSSVMRPRKGMKS
jgi:hypothetical protein